METDSARKPWTLESWFARIQPSRKSFSPRRSIVLGAALLAFLLSWMPAVKTIDFEWYQFLLGGTNAETTFQPVSLVLEVGEKTSHDFGPWPWTNAQLADTIVFFSKQNVSAIYLDAPLKPTDHAADAALENALMHYGQNVYVLNDDLNSSARFNVQTRGQAQITSENKIDGISRLWIPAMRADKLTSGLHASLQVLTEVFPDAFQKIEKHLNTHHMLIPWSARVLKNIQTEEYSDWLKAALNLDATKNIPDRYQLAGRVVWVGSAVTNFEMDYSHEPVSRVRLAAMLFEQMRNGLAHAPVSKGVDCAILFVFMAACLIFCRRRGIIFWGMWLILILTAPILSLFVLRFFSFFCSPVSILIFGVVTALGLLIEDLLYAENEKKIFFYLATRDGLTNLYGIRHFRLIMNQLTKEAADRNEKLALILLDLDHFKKINDTFGHPAGDEVIKKTAETLVAVVRQKRPMQDIDFIARYGGEEFMILIRKADLKTTAEVAERIREAIENSYFSWNDMRIYVTVSIGVAALRENENVPDAMVHRADQALYKAKNQGRNRVSFDEDE